MSMDKNKKDDLVKYLSPSEWDEYHGLLISGMYGSDAPGDDARMDELAALAEQRSLEKQAAESVGTSTRDRVVVAVANLILRLASEEYRMLVRGAIEYGMRAAARDHKEGRDTPGDWRKS